METQTPESTYQAAIDQIVGDLFRTMLATEVSPTTQSPAPGKDVITAFLPFAGPWQGELVLECHRPQAVCFARRFLQSDDLEEFSEDIPGTVAELANIIGGNLKVVMPTGIVMGTPSIIEGTDYTIRLCGGKSVCDRAYSTDAGAFNIRLIEDPGHSGGKL